MIELKNVTLNLGTRLIFENFNLHINKGEKIGIVGGEGAGKTTLLDVIAGRVATDSGEVNVTGHIVPVSRNVYANFSELRMAEMSLAEKFKMTITKTIDAVKSEDKILLLDEPTKNLDSDEIEWLIDVLKTADSLTVVVASNDRYFLKKVCSRTITLGNSNASKIVLPTVEPLTGEEEVLNAENLLKVVDGETVFQKVSFTILHGQKVALVGKNSVGKSKMLKVFGAGIPVQGEFQFSPSVKTAYMPRVYSGAAAKTELEKLINSEANFLILDEPTVCLDLLTIIELENALKDFKGTVIFSDSDHEFIQAVATRIIDITPDGTVDRISKYDDFLANETVQQQISEKYKS